MFILTIQTQKPEAEICLYDNEQQLACLAWEAHRRLAETIHTQIAALLAGQDRTLQTVEGIILYAGPGSFTGLRIGAAVANALASNLEIPIVGKTGQKWIEAGLKALSRGDNDRTVTLQYGSAPRTTQPRK